ncbi:succinate dehydrogenase iron-sulfur subunit [Ferroacidibacillus organovorans]|uniref:succinate dehydrogenase n=1 Tax=Ferroacidibacillus organovorans TaxID=1765683 RepID=A0A117SYB7_9BACL|nr:succinate dehydrogenase iron-sulfur subunit [Ferroacidibacillus organovorans]KUO96680.1 succinate dehydrogenase [Ferroacidibacillus organovorans]
MAISEQEATEKRSSKTVRFVIERQESAEAQPYTEEFEIAWRPGMNVIAALMEIQRNPVNASGQETKPVTWESNCLEEVCGACTMVINGKPRQACSALVDKLTQPIDLKPMRTFPVVRDLVVNRSRMFDILKRVKAWVPIDGTYDLGPGPRMAESERQWAYELSKCFTCGSCVEACPNVNEKTGFIGAFAISQARLFNTHPTGSMHKDERLEALMDEGGIHECGNSQNCVQVCPKGIPLTTSIAAMNRDVNRHAFSSWLKK